MSMDFSVYVGPYLKVTGVAWEHIEEFDHLLCDGRMEAVDNTDKYLIPNSKVDGIDRQTNFDRFDGSPIVPISVIEFETEFDDFKAHCQPFLDSLKPPSVATVQWGVVTRWS